MKVIVIDQHPIDDDRIIRQIRYLLSRQISVIRLHYNRDDPALTDGYFSLFGEIGDRINVRPFKNRVISSLYFNLLFCLTPLVFFSVKEFLEHEVKGDPTPTIIHVHDAVFLNLAIIMKKKMYPDAKIVYDRHELFEYKIRKFGINITRIPRLYEILTEKKIDGVVSVSNHHNQIIQHFFPHALITTIPNFPLTNEYNLFNISKKINHYNELSNLNLIYIGSLDNNFDRDIPFLLTIADSVLQKFPRASFTIGGECTNLDLKTNLFRLGEKHPNRFHYLGRIPRETTVKLTENSHIGFFLLQPSTTYWVKCSPNKIFEYLICGVIPIIRADVDYIAELRLTSMIFDRFESEKEIIESVETLIDNPERCKQMMTEAHELGKYLSFDRVGQNYIDLYNELLT